MSLTLNRLLHATRQLYLIDDIYLLCEQMKINEFITLKPKISILSGWPVLDISPAATIFSPRLPEIWPTGRYKCYYLLRVPLAMEPGARRAPTKNTRRLKVNWRKTQNRKPPQSNRHDPIGPQSPDRRRQSLSAPTRL